MTIFFAGDAQGDVVKIENADTQKRVKSQLPAQIDLLLAPIGWIADIMAPAKAYADFLQPRTLIPMHSWSAQEKANFLDLFKSDNKRYIVVDSQSPDWEAFAGKPAPEMQVVGLTAASYQK